MHSYDNKKQDLYDWAKFNRDLLAEHVLYATGTTGSALEEQLDMRIHKLGSGPLGGNQQIGARIVGNEIDFVIFFWDPLEPLPHDPDIKALLRISVVWNIPVACNCTSADFMISSPLMSGTYQCLIPDYSTYRSPGGHGRALVCSSSWAWDRNRTVGSGARAIPAPAS